MSPVAVVTGAELAGVLAALEELLLLLQAASTSPAQATTAIISSPRLDLGP